MRLTRLALLAAVAAVLLTAGTAFTVELLQRVFSQDYRSLAQASAAQGWPEIALYGVRWSPDAVLTWLVPASLLTMGTGAAWLARQQLRALRTRDDKAAAAPTVPVQRQAA